MKSVRSIWLPDTETHMQNFINSTGTYQRNTLLVAVAFCEQKRNAIDIGAHCGLWSMHLTKLFNHVDAFEPIKAHRECFDENVEGSVKLYPFALGDTDGDVFLHLEEDNTGHTHIAKEGVKARMKKLDSFDFREVDFIKMDCEGFEYFVCLGGEETIKREKPIICLEQKPHGFYGIDTHAGVKLLHSWGMKEFGRVSADFIMGW